MSTDFTMPVQQFTASPSQYTLYNSQSQQTSPINSATATPSNSSPTSPRNSVLPFLPVHTRQLRPPKSPLYVPAVLRPTDPPKRTVRPSPLTPPVSRHNSFDPFENTRTLSRRSTGNSDLESVLENENSTEGLGKVTALPTRKHWKPDPESTVCDEAVCTRFFTYFTRRHHCRHCGNIFCDLHSVHSIPLDQDANYHPGGTQSRSCERCWVNYCSWQRARCNQSNSESSQSDQEAPATPRTPIINCRNRSAIASIFESKTQGTPESFGKSVPRDWNWSTF